MLRREKVTYVRKNYKDVEINLGKQGDLGNERNNWILLFLLRPGILLRSKKTYDLVFFYHWSHW